MKFVSHDAVPTSEDWSNVHATDPVIGNGIDATTRSLQQKQSKIERFLDEDHHFSL